MAKSNKSFSGLFRSKAPTDLIGSSAGRIRAGGRSESAPRQSGLQAISLSATRTLTGIDFGSPSSPSSTSTSTSGSNWTNLLEHTASRSLTSAVKGTFSLADLGGIGSILSGISKLFGGGSDAKTLPPLVESDLPSPVAETVYLSSRGSKTEVSPYATTGSSNQNAQIVQAVKHALLTSSSLNDVIAEI